MNCWFKNAEFSFPVLLRTPLKITGFQNPLLPLSLTGLHAGIMTYKTKGIILRTVNYGDTSVICTVYTEIFGLQSYLVKGIRQSSRKNPNRIASFQPAAMLDMVVTHQELKNLQYIREFQWGYLYRGIFSEIVKNSVAVYLIELLLQGLKQPESNPELYHFIETSLLQLDTGSDRFVANLPLYFTLLFGTELGFSIQGGYGENRTYLDFREGKFVKELPQHPYYLEKEAARITAEINHAHQFEGIEQLDLPNKLRRDLLESYLQFIRLHIEDFGEPRSLKILQEILR